MKCKAATQYTAHRTLSESLFVKLSPGCRSMRMEQASLTTLPLIFGNTRCQVIMRFLRLRKEDAVSPDAQPPMLKRDKKISMEVKKSYYMNMNCEFLAYISRRKIITEEERTQVGGECGDVLDSADSIEDF